MPKITKTNLLLLVFTLVLSPFFLKAQNSIVKNASSISGVISGANDENVFLHFVTDIITGGKETIAVPVNQNNAFSVSFSIREPVECVIEYQFISQKIVIFPGKDLILTINPKFDENAIAILGEGAFDNKIISQIRSDLDLFCNSNEETDLFLLKSKVESFNTVLLNELRKNLDKLSSQAIEIINYDIFFGLKSLLLEQGEMFSFKYPTEKLLNEYYHFLRHPQKNLQEVIFSPYYKKYIKLYLKFREDYPEFRIIEEVKKEFVVKSTSKYLYYAPGIDSVLMKLTYDDTLKYSGVEFLNDKESNGIGLSNLQNYKWYEVEIGKIKGWVSATDILDVNVNSHINIIKNPKLVKRIILECEILHDNIKMVKAGHDQEVVDVLNRGDVLDFLNVKTNEKYAYTINDVNYIDYFYKLRTKSGLEGWMPKLSYRLVERELTVKNTLESVKSIDYLQTYVNGIDLYYLSAVSLVNNYKDERKEAIRSEINNFYALNDCRLLKNSIVSNIPTSYINSLSTSESSPLEVFEPLVSDVNILSSTTALRSDLFGKIKTETSLLNGIRMFFGDSLIDNSSYNILLSNYVKNIEYEYVPLKGEVPYAEREEVTDKVVSLNIDFIFEPVDGIETIVNIENAKNIDNLIVNNDIFGNLTTNYNLKNFTSHLAKIELTLDSPVLLSVFKNEKEYFIFLEPGDELTYDALEKSYFNIANDNNDHIDELLDLIKVFKNTTFSYDSLLVEFDLLNQKIGDVLFSYNTSSTFVGYIKDKLNYSFGNKLLLLDGNPVRIEGQLKAISFDSKNREFIKDYQQYLFNYIKWQANHIENMDVTEYATSHLNANTLSFYNAYAIFLNILENEFSIDKSKLLEFLSKKNNAKYNRVLKYTYNQYKGIPFGSLVPDFNLLDIEGRTVSISEFKNKIVYIDFWASWCPPCTKSMKSMQPIIEANPDVVFLFINLNANETAYKSYIYNNDLKGTFLYGNPYKDGASAVSEAYGVTDLPKTYIIDRQGRVIYNSSYIKTGLTVEDLLKMVSNSKW